MGSVLVLSVQDPTPDPVVIGSRISELVPDPVQPGPKTRYPFLLNPTPSKGASHSHAQNHHLKPKYFERETGSVTIIPNSQTHLKFISNNLEVGKIDNSNNS